MKGKTILNLFVSSWNLLFFLCLFVGATWHVYYVGLSIGSIALLLFSTISFALVARNWRFKIDAAKEEYKKAHRSGGEQN